MFSGLTLQFSPSFTTTFKLLLALYSFKYAWILQTISWTYNGISSSNCVPWHALAECYPCVSDLSDNNDESCYLFSDCFMSNASISLK